MHTTMLLLLFVLFVDGVSGADPDETLSVMEGDSVTLHTGLTEILNDHTILWKFGPKGSFISQIARKNNLTSFHYTDDVGFRGRLQVDQNTGSLTIRNTRERHSGQYQVTISRVTISKSKTFNVTVQRVDSGTGGVKSKSVMEGEPVTLNPDPTQIHGDDLVLWRFGDILLAKIDVENKQISLNDADEGYRDRLQLDQTGSLTITNTRTTDSGHYHLQIRGSESSQQFILTVSQRGLSPGGKAGIVLVFLAAVVVAAAGFIYYRRKISELQKQILTLPVTVTVPEGEYITLKPNKEIQKGDGILWMFGEEEQQTSIAKFIGETGEFVTHDYAADGRFRDRLVLDETTGSLTIRNSITTHSGLYTLHITSSSGDSQQRFIVTVSENEEISVEEGGSVTLKPDTEIQRDEEIQWIFGDQYVLIAQIRGGTGEICIYDDVLDGRFRGRLKLEKTGSLTITNIKPEHTGLYKLQIITSRGTLCKRFRVSIPRRDVSVIEGESVHLSTDRPKIERDDEIQWRFGDENSLIAEVKEGTGKTHDGAAERFRDRLQLDKITGDLTIKSSTATDTGRYKLKISSSKGNTDKNYMVRITDEVKRVFVTVGESVHLSTDRPKIERDDEIQWRFRDEIIAEIKEGTGETHDGADGRFRDRLQLDKRTGDLTIKNSTDEDTGRYNLKIRSRKGTTDKTYIVIITVRYVYVTAGESVHLPTDRPKIERDDVIQWRFRDEIIAEIKEGTGETRDGADGRFRDRLQLNDQTGDLTIKNSTAKDVGYYKLNIRSSKGNTNWTYNVGVTDKATGKPLMKGNNGKRVDESASVVIPLLDK